MAKIQVSQKAHLAGHNASVFALSAGEQERFFYSGAGDGWIVRWDLDNPDPGRLVAKADTQIFALLHIRPEEEIIAGDMNGGVHWIDLSDPASQKNITAHQKGVFQLARVGENIYSIGGDGKITKWDIAQRRATESLHLSNRSLRCLDYCESRNELAVGSSDFNIYFLNASSLELKATIAQAHRNSVFSVRYSPDGTYLLSGGRDAFLKVWDFHPTIRCISEQPAHLYTINDIAFHPEGNMFATASRDRSIKIWDARNYELLKVVEAMRDGGHVNSVNQLLWSTHQQLLLSCSDDRSIKIWELAG